MHNTPPRFVLTVLFVCTLSLSASARTIFVNNLAGDDQYDGTAGQRESGSVGPLRTLHRAVRVATFGDTIVLANTGEPYYEGLTLVGAKHSGNATVPFRIVGNGATLSGLQPVPKECWRNHQGKLWSFEPEQKGHYLLRKSGEAVERFPVDLSQHRPDELPAGKFAVCRGRVFYRASPGEDVPALDFQIAQQTTGVSLYAVHHVIIENLNVQHFRIDGLNAHDLCRNVLISGISSMENGRSGVTVTGSSRVVLRKCAVTKNLESSVRIMERGEADVQDSELDAEPSLIR